MQFVEMSIANTVTGRTDFRVWRYCNFTRRSQPPLIHSLAALTLASFGALLAGCETSVVAIRTDATGPDATGPDATVDAPGTVPADASVPVSADYCPTVPTFMQFNASERFRRYTTGGYGNRPDIGAFARPESLHAGETFVIRLDVAATDSTVGGFAAGLNYGDIGASRAGKLVSLSRSRCDFNSTAILISGNRPTNSASASLSINEPTRLDASPLTTGTWYINLQIPLDQCPPATACDVVVEWSNGM